jgi:saccharopine dehydrogenase-like NADP-dependent oxidoreductase
MKKILVLGAGMVSRPLVKYLLAQGDFEVIIATRTVSKAFSLLENHPHGKAVSWVTDDMEGLEKLVKDTDVAISLLPAAFHVKVAELCVNYRKHMVTTSYVSDAMKALDKTAKDQGVLLLNELGVDPGIDHMSAMKIINDVSKKGGFISSFRSYCGGLPAPDANTNPWGYKFSWSPRAVLMAVRNNARYLKDGNEVVVPAQKLFSDFHVLKFNKIPDLEAYPNRDSLGYISLYGLHNVKTMYRGTLRNLGWCELWQQIYKIGILSLEEITETSDLTYAGLTAGLIKSRSTENLKQKVAEFLGIEVTSPHIGKMEWLGLFSHEPVKMDKITALDAFSNILQKKLEYMEGERDMIVLHHRFVAEYPSEKKTENIYSTMIDFGIPYGDSSMARTVSLPAAIATKFILRGKFRKTGVHIPVDSDIYEPVLAELETMNIKVEENWSAE